MPDAQGFLVDTMDMYRRQGVDQHYEPIGYPMAIPRRQEDFGRGIPISTLPTSQVWPAYNLGPVESVPHRTLWQGTIPDLPDPGDAPPRFEGSSRPPTWSYDRQPAAPGTRALGLTTNPGTDVVRLLVCPAEPTIVEQRLKALQDARLVYGIPSTMAADQQLIKSELVPATMTVDGRRIKREETPSMMTTNTHQVKLEDIHQIKLEDIPYAVTADGRRVKREETPSMITADTDRVKLEDIPWAVTAHGRRLKRGDTS